MAATGPSCHRRSVSQLLDHVPTITGTALVTTGQRQWLFPGQLAGRPRSAASLQRQLRKHGIGIRAARNAALIALAADLPAPVLAEVPGISFSGAVQWARRAGRSWHTYLQTRLDHPPPAGKITPDGLG
ncbi:hypothetical protein AB0368_37450 [Actinoplanes sp. NPDC051475]|uniref:hypothetical protein n=1 Tax=Actinoplanes sp. NPDC051475 TaxID=3157225 RepID=UPI00344D0A0A